MNFLMEFPETLSGNICEDIISTFEKRTDLQFEGSTSKGVKHEHKKDTEITINDFLFSQSDWSPLLQEVFSALEVGLSKYKKEFSVNREIGIDNIADWSVEHTANIQKFLPSEGYKIWHCEAPNKNYCDRVLVWMFYLNTIDDKGGTEFYFQNKTVKAEQGKLVIWPPYWTHFHKSEVSNSETKYIITGWFNFK
jgi:hypothetical protein